MSNAITYTQRQIDKNFGLLLYFPDGVIEREIERGIGGEEREGGRRGHGP